MKTKGGGRLPPKPPPQTKVTIVGKNEIYNKENLVGPFLVHKIFGSQTPSPPPPSAQQTPCPLLSSPCARPYPQTNISMGDLWLRGMAVGAASSGRTVQFCMHYPNDLLAAAALPAVTNARATGDYFHGAHQWAIGATALVSWALGVLPFKDGFYSSNRVQVRAALLRTRCAWEGPLPHSQMPCVGPQPPLTPPPPGAPFNNSAGLPPPPP